MQRHPVIGVLGGSGGVGASTFAAVLALVAGPAMLVDLDPPGGGVDVALGIEHEPGARWSGLALAGGHLDPQVLADGLPRAGPCTVLAADTDALDSGAVRQVLGAAREIGPVVVDLPRAAAAVRAAALLHCDLLVVLVRCDVGGLVAAHTLVAGLPELPIGVVARRADVDPSRAAHLVGARLLGVLPALGSGGVTLDPDRPPRSLARVAAGVLSGALSEPIAGPVGGQVARHAAWEGPNRVDESRAAS